MNGSLAPPLTSCCAAWFLTGHGPVPDHGPGVADPCSSGLSVYNSPSQLSLLLNKKFPLLSLLDLHVVCYSCVSRIAVVFCSQINLLLLCWYKKKKKKKKKSARQCRGHRFDPWWSGKIPHAEEQLSPCATTTEPTCCNY